MTAYLAASFFFLLMLFGPKTVGANFDTLGASCAIAAAVWWQYSYRALELPDFWITVLAMAYILLVLAATGVPDQWWRLKPPRVLLNYLGVFGFVTWGLARFGPARMLLMLHNAVTVHAVIILLMAASQAFSDLIEGLFGGVTRSEFQISGLTRGLALSAIVMMFPFVTYPLFAMLHGYRERGIAIKLALILAATFFMGRTGFYMSLGIAAVIMLLLGLRSLRAMKITLLTFATLGLAGVLLVQFRVAPDSSIVGAIPGSSHVADPISHMLEPIINYVLGYGFTAQSIEHVMSMPVVYHNDSVLDTLFGTGLYGRGDWQTYLPTDVAYLHMFSAFGVVGVALFLLAYLTPYAGFFGLRRTAAFWASLAIAMMVIVANMKETALFTRNIYTVHVFFIAWLAHDLRVRATGASFHTQTRPHAGETNQAVARGAA